MSNHETSSNLNMESLRNRAAAVLSTLALSGGMVATGEEPANAESIDHEGVYINTAAACDEHPETGEMNIKVIMQVENTSGMDVATKLSVPYEDEPDIQEVYAGYSIQHEGHSEQTSIPAGEGEYDIDFPPHEPDFPEKMDDTTESGSLSYKSVRCNENGVAVENTDDEDTTEEEPGVGGGIIDTSTACPPEEMPDHGFPDVEETNVHGDMISCVTWYEITHGKTEYTYAPAGQVTRGQMASFIARSMDVTDIEMPQPSDQGFTDTEGNVHEDNINRLAELGVVKGVDAETYAPRIPVTRAQMASFLVRAFEKVTGRELGATSDHFSDDNGSVHEENINAAAEIGMTAGKTLDTYEPHQPVRRDQMASFLARKLELLRREDRVIKPNE